MSARSIELSGGLRSADEVRRRQGESRRRQTEFPIKGIRPRSAGGSRIGKVYHATLYLALLHGGSEMTGELPEPLVPENLDLRDFRWMKLDLIALFNSDFNATPDDTAWRAGVTLWGKAWHQVPAGSLPNDDTWLCNLAGLGRDLKTWRRIKSVALHGFELCSDNRLYHRFICPMAREVAAGRDQHERKKAADRERKSRGNGENSGGTPGGTHQNSGGIPPEPPHIPHEVARKNLLEGEGEGEYIYINNIINPSARACARASPPANISALAVRRKELLRNKVMRFAYSRLDSLACEAALIGLMGDDPAHDAQWWLDSLDRQMRSEGWDDRKRQPADLNRTAIGSQHAG